ncbi:Protein RCR2 [Colletotrichum orbiculare MAFF 240422]|uniref:Protein RCR2 n=3 Tax=Colletotrichum orbiculare species complex TaxID=2707354 RepID=N4VB30_COLOR|nr:Protein RCR2 [Colletotrichum orbiculare MAFF 240422]TDZ27146.1 Protein RCR2 [Colletotrichum spinosum]TDZ74475.1 Protein RCR2 [Colletotrichum trifolii]
MADIAGEFHILPVAYDGLEKRQQRYCDAAGRCYYERTGWHYWGRWVLAAVVLGIAILILVMLGCLSSRRRRKRGMTPFYGTGWMTNNQKFHTQQQGTYAHNQQYNGQQGGYSGYQNPPPAYGQQQQTPQYTGTTFNPNDGYYGGHNEGIHLQQPQNAYARDNTYSPPAGPPPGK